MTGGGHAPKPCANDQAFLGMEIMSDQTATRREVLIQ